MNKEPSNDEIKQTVRKNYSAIAQNNSPCCGPAPGCCGAQTDSPSAIDSAKLGYSAEQLSNIPEGADMGLGCGNPQEIAKLKPGMTVLDLGSGGGFDCFLAARQVGETGRVIGVDMTPEMIRKAEENARKGDYKNVEFRLGEIEKLTVEDSTIDVILSNCVINLSPDKQSVYREAWRVLKPGGRLAISDVIALKPLPEELRNDWALYTGCVAGAVAREEIEDMLAAAGFQKIVVTPNAASGKFIDEWMPGANLSQYIASAGIEAIKIK